MSGDRRVVVTGMGFVTPLGNEVERVWEALVSGRSGIRAISHFDASGFPTKIAGEVRDFDAERILGRLDEMDSMGKHSLFGLASAQMAFDDAGLDGASIDPERVGVYMGCDEGVANFDWLAQRIASDCRKGRTCRSVSPQARWQEGWRLREKS
jgi:3-oxoacyl-[acyl-carrier-protein] synthase II